MPSYMHPTGRYKLCTIFVRPRKWYILNLYGLSTRYGYLFISNNPSIIRGVAVSQIPFNVLVCDNNLIPTTAPTTCVGSNHRTVYAGFVAPLSMFQCRFSHYRLPMLSSVRARLPASGHIKTWWRWVDSNHRPSDYDSAALTN